MLKVKGYYNRLWSRQSKTKSPKGAGKDAPSKQKQKQQGPDTADLIDVSDTRSVADAGDLGKNELSNNHTTLNSGFPKSTLKPDAPEFVPTSRRLAATEAFPKQDDENESQVHVEHHQAGEENGTPQGMLDGRTGEPVESKKGSKRKHSRRASSILRQTSNGVVMAYPKKARKTAGDSKKRSLRRRRIESEPIVRLLGS